MSKSKSYNRIVFLTTLSLYLGLVLVGGTAPVLAHSATTKSFDVHNEIELKDDLDNKPDNNESEWIEDSLGEYYVEPIKKLLQDLRDLKNSQNFALDNYQFESRRNFFTQCHNAEDTILIIPKDFGVIGNKFLASAVKETKDKFEYLSNFSACFSRNGFDESGARKSHASVRLDKSGFKIEVSLKKNSADEAERFLKNLKSAAGNYFEKNGNLSDFNRNSFVQILDRSTVFHRENKQVFIVTRLPRAAIDEFLADKNAQ